MFINNQMVFLYIFPHYCVYMCLLCTPNTFLGGKWGYIWDVCVFQRPRTRQRKGPDLIPQKGEKRKLFFFKNQLREFFFQMSFYWRHPDCLKLPHAEKQSENVEFKSELIKIKLLSVESGAVRPSLLWVALSLSSEGAMSSGIQPPPPQNPNTH